MVKNKELKVGKPAPESRLYSCSTCGNVAAMIKGEVASRCETCIMEDRPHAWKPTKQEIMLKTKHVAKEVEKRKIWADHVADKITEFCGSIAFVYMHIVWFALWLLINLGLFGRNFIFDPFPFGLLTLIVSLEAIFLATFILISQNRQAEVSELRSELDYQTDLKSEKHIEEILAFQRRIYDKVKRKR